MKNPKHQVFIRLNVQFIDVSSRLGRHSRAVLTRNKMDTIYDFRPTCSVLTLHFGRPEKYLQ